MSAVAEIGAIVDGTIEKVTEYGAFIKLESGETGMVHISQVDNSYVKDINDFIHVGDVVKVKIVGQKEDGRIDLSIKQAQPGFEERPARRSGAPGATPAGTRIAARVPGIGPGQEAAAGSGHNQLASLWLRWRALSRL